MTEKKRQRFKVGSICKLKLSKNKFIFGRMLPGFQISIYDLLTNSDIDMPSIDEIIKNKILLTVGIYRNNITKRIFEIVGFKELTQTEIDKIPPMFMQSLGDYEDCSIFYHDGKEYKVSPKECIGLERSAVWDEHSLIERIEDFYKGNKNFHVELQKVILSSDDPRYLNPNVRWDFKEGKFYKE